ncbi:unnamed protein product [Polarella glacialis]|uniref:Uncharacterized protein n=1 Tax=Polarella glacialis TaxID=89957 RepID=A0A813HJS9_POLGL|nr:unnamed protein product [Polarella glacialis]
MGSPSSWSLFSDKVHRLCGNGRAEEALSLTEATLASLQLHPSTATSGGSSSSSSSGAPKCVEESLLLSLVSDCRLAAGLPSLESANEALLKAKDAVAASAGGDKGAIRALAAANLAISWSLLAEDQAASLAAAKEASRLFREAGDKGGQSAALVAVAGAETAPERARQAARSALALAQEAGDKRREAGALSALLREAQREASQAAEATTTTRTTTTIPATTTAAATTTTATHAALTLARELSARKAEAAVLKTVASKELLPETLQDLLQAPLGTGAIRGGGSSGEAVKNRRSYVEALTSQTAVSFVPKETLGLAQEGLELFRGLGDQRGQADMLLVMAASFTEQSSFEPAVRSAREALAISKQLVDRARVLASLNVVINIFAQQSPMEPQAMLETAQEGVLFFKGLEQEDRKGLALALQLLAAVRYAVSSGSDRPREAEQASADAARAFRELGDPEGEASVWKSVVYAHLANDQPAAALMAAEEALAIYQAAGDRTQQVHILDAMASLLILRENTKKALKVGQDALSLARDIGDHRLQLAVMGTIVEANLVREDHQAAIVMSKEVVALKGELGDIQGQASALSMLFKVYLVQGSDNEAFGAGHEAMAALQKCDHRGELAMAEFLAHVLLQKRSPEAVHVARRALSLARELSLRFSEGNALFLIGKCDLRSQEGLRSVLEAGKIFKELGLKKAEATSLHAAANSWLVQRRPSPTDALREAQEGLAVYRETADRRGEAIMLHTMANCHLALRETERGVSVAYEALHLFEQLGDDYGVRLATKLLLGSGQSEEDLREATRIKASFDGLETKASAATGAMRRRDEEAQAQTLQDEQVLWEYAWVPQETQDFGKLYGEKRPGGAFRRIFVASELRDPGLLRQLGTCWAGSSSSPAKSPACFGNLINGRLLAAGSIQSAMEASRCASAVYDVSMLNHLTPLEVMDVALRLVQALQTIEEPKVALDIITASTQHMAYTHGLRDPFHATLWGFARTARIENPQHEFRCLDVDAGCRWEDMAFITRYLMGAQSTRLRAAACVLVCWAVCWSAGRCAGVLGGVLVCWCAGRCAGVLGGVLVCWAVCWCAGRCAGVLGGVLVCWAVCWCAGRCAGVLGGVLVCWAVCWCAGRCAGVLAGVLVCWAVCWCAGRCAGVLGGVLVCWAVCWCARRCAGVLGGVLVCWAVCWCAGRCAGRCAGTLGGVLVSWAVCWCAGRCAGVLGGVLVCWAVCWCARRCAGVLVCWAGCWCAGRRAGVLVCWCAGVLGGVLGGVLVCWAVCWCAGRCAAVMDGVLACWAVCWSAGRCAGVLGGVLVCWYVWLLFL